MDRPEEKGFIEGIAFACAYLGHYFDEPAMAAEIIASAGYRRIDFKVVAEFDRREIYKLFKNEKRILGNG